MKTYVEEADALVEAHLRLGGLVFVAVKRVARGKYQVYSSTGTQATKVLVGSIERRRSKSWWQCNGIGLCRGRWATCSRLRDCEPTFANWLGRQYQGMDVELEADD